MTIRMPNSSRLMPIMLIAAALVLAAAAPAGIWPERSKESHCYVDSYWLGKKEGEQVEEQIKSISDAHNCDVMVGIFGRMPTKDSGEAIWQIEKAWRMGEGHGDGRFILFVAFKREHVIRIVCGSAFATTELPRDERAIIDDEVANRLEIGDTSGAISIALTKIEQALDGTYIYTPPAPTYAYTPAELTPDDWNTMIIIASVAVLVLILIFAGAKLRFFDAFSGMASDRTTGIYYGADADTRPLRQLLWLSGFRSVGSVLRWWRSNAEDGSRVDSAAGDGVGDAARDDLRARGYTRGDERPKSSSVEQGGGGGCSGSW